YRAEFSGASCQLEGREKSYLVRVPLIGRFNVANSMAALAASNSLGVSLREAILSLAKAPQVPGRLEAVPAKRQFQVFVDYAHTDDALLNVMKTLRELSPRKLIVVFGCGGDRDRQKRPLMGRVADQNADYSIITSDNPRKEDPDAIIAEVEKGFRSGNYEKIADRAHALITAGDRALSISRISTDSRTLKAGDLFVPLRGENFDGHRFIEQAAERGAAGAMVEENWQGSPPGNFALIRVPDTL